MALKAISILFSRNRDAYVMTGCFPLPNIFERASKNVRVTVSDNNIAGVVDHMSQTRSSFDQKPHVMSDDQHSNDDFVLIVEAPLRAEWCIADNERDGKTIARRVPLLVLGRNMPCWKRIPVLHQ